MTTILVVEDESAVASVVQKSLMKMGYQVPSIASTGEEALKQAGDLRPDLVLMDIGLKGRMDGIKAAESIRDLYELPVVYLTGYADEERLSRARVTDAYGYILKPFNNNELRSTIEMALYKHQMALRLKERERWFSTTLRSIGDAVIAVDSEEHVTFMNPVAEALTGWPHSEASGKKLGEVYRVVEEESRAGAPSAVERALREGMVVGLSPHRVLIGRDGHEVSIDDSAAPIKDDKGNVMGVVLVFRDVTERKRLEKRLTISERLASLGTLAAGIAHEINNPLAYVIANAEFCKKALERMEREVLNPLIRGEDVPAARSSADRYLEDIRAALQEAIEGADRMRRIVADVKTFSRPEGELRTSVDVRQVLEASVKMASSLLPERARIVRDYQDVPAIQGNESRLGQLFVNLLMNAAQAIPEGHKDQNEIRLTTRPGPGSSVVVEVRDSGAGIPPDVMRRIFDPFFSTKPVGVGTGLGLAICHRIVTDLGGEILVESQVGRGSVFTVILPTQPGATTERPRARVLVVDADAGLTGALQEVLGGSHEVTTAANGIQALSLIERQAFDLILCDMALPDMTGMELYAKLRREAPQDAARLVFIRGAETPELRDFLQSVPNRWLTRPLDPEHVRQVLQPLLQ